MSTSDSISAPNNLTPISEEEPTTKVIPHLVEVNVSMEDELSTERELTQSRMQQQGSSDFNQEQVVSKETLQ